LTNPAARPADGMSLGTVVAAVLDAAASVRVVIPAEAGATVVAGCTRAGGAARVRDGLTLGGTAVVAFAERVAVV